MDESGGVSTGGVVLRDELFSYYVEIGHTMYYYKHYIMASKRTENLYSSFLLLASAWGIGTMALWEKIPAAWAIILFLAQVLQTIKPLMPFSKREEALRYIVQDYEQIFNEIWELWFTVYDHQMEPENISEIKNTLLDWKRRERAAIDRFAPNLDFPFNKRADKKARKENEKYFWYHYSVKTEEELEIECTEKT